MKQIPLRARDGSLRAVAIVDDPDFAVIGSLRWALHHKGYAVRTFDGKQTSLHRYLMGLQPGDPREVDHINGDKLDNRRVNLRIVTRAENAQNLAVHPGASSHRGVSFNAKTGRWYASVKVARKTTFIGSFEREIDAARAASAYREKHLPFTNEHRYQETTPA